MLFNLALEKTIREMQKAQTGITIGVLKIQAFGLADDITF